MVDKVYTWHFPLPRTHTGILQGNARLGVMIWGGVNVLRLTLGRADLWDHRGGMDWTPEMNYPRIRALLEAGDEAGLRAIFENTTPAKPSEPRNQTVVPVGRVDLEFDAGVELRRGLLKLATGQVEVILSDRDGREHSVLLDLAINDPLLHVEWPRRLPAPRVVRVPAWESVGERLAKVSFRPPEMIDLPELTGWVQALPSDPPVCVGYRVEDRGLWIVADRGADAKDARVEAATLLSLAVREGADRLRRDTGAWWQRYWSRAPRIDIPNDTLSFAYHYGMYKFAGLTAPRGVPATLQGPWIEDYQMPPWSSDYHFNINVQMCYWPAYQGDQLHHLRPVLEMVWSWRERLREYARLFVGVEDGLLLPHSVDDRGRIIGGFWSGTIDHGCTAWVGKMMYDLWLYGGGDEAYLRDVVHPFLSGTMRVYEAMLVEEVGGEPEVRSQEPEAKRYTLPVSVSPEYRGNAMNAWGRDASFQLGWIHWLIEALLKVCDVIGVQPKPIWREIQRGLPKATRVGREGRRRIGLWEGTDLEESHRHHSHMAGIVPIDVIDVDDPHWQPIVAETYRRWVAEGMGIWSGWCMPWAAMLQSRIGNADAAELTLEIWDRLFTNEGHGTLHNVHFLGISTMHWGPNAPEVMQMDAGMAATAAVMDMLVHVKRGVHHVFKGAPARWREASFEGIRTEGGFLVSARRTRGRVDELSIVADRGGIFRLASPWPGARCRVESNGASREFDGPVVEIEIPSGQRAMIRPIGT